MHRFADRFTNRMPEINRLNSLPDDTYTLGCMTGADMKKAAYLKCFRDNDDVVNIALDGLPDRYQHVSDIIIHRDPFPDLKTARSMLTMAEMRLKSRAQVAHVDSTSSSPMVLLASRGSISTINSPSNLTKNEITTLQGLLAKMGTTGNSTGLGNTHVPNNTRLRHVTNHRGYCCLDLKTNKIIISRHVNFDETVFFGLMTPTSSPSYDFLDEVPNVISNYIRLSPTNIPLVTVQTTNTDPPIPPPTSPNLSSTGPTTDLIPHGQNEGPTPDGQNDDNTNTIPHDPTMAVAEPITSGPSHTNATQPPPTTSPTHTDATNQPPTHATPTTTQPAYVFVSQSSSTPNDNWNPISIHPMITRFRVGTNRPTHLFTLHVINVSHLPKSYRDAFNDPNWQNAMSDEYNALIKNNTWTFVPRPMDANIVHFQVDLTKEFLSSRFLMKDMGEANVILVSTYMDTSEKMPNNGQVVSQLKYSMVIGYVMYTMTCIRPHIAFEVVLEGYTDASWINNTKDNSSTNGWVFLLGGASSKKAEWLENLIIKIPLWSKPITHISILCDSAPTLAKPYSQMYNGKSRHLVEALNVILVEVKNKNIIYGIEPLGSCCYWTSHYRSHGPSPPTRPSLLIESCWTILKEVLLIILIKRLYHLERNKNVLACSRGRWVDGKWEWVWDWIRYLRGRAVGNLGDLEELIKEVSLNENRRDGWKWRLDPSEVFSVRSKSHWIEERRASRMLRVKKPDGLTSFLEK
nr:hypothetical protein [Tanacetum cinerariifolium]